ncbi:MAG: GTP-binding protein [Planctomycetota bacterium]|nr:MAG: GTP-binding protein [Planctomycetota bacterium]
MAGVAANLLTGFLGSGKTTLLKHVLEHGLEGRRVAIIMNEIGDIGIDGQVITGMENVEEMVELSSGCICCSVSGQFGLAIREIVETVEPHLIVVESTGLAEPQPMVQTVLEAGLAMDAVITVVDAANLARAVEESPVAIRQVEGADFLVLNKIDLVSEAELQKIEKQLRRWNPRALVQHSRFGEVRTDLLFGTSAGRYRKEAGKPEDDHHHLDEDGIQAFSYLGDSEEFFLRDRFEAFLDQLPRDIYRAKGLVRFHGSSALYLFNYTCGRYRMEAMNFAAVLNRPSQAVFIGRRALQWKDKIEAKLQACRPNLNPWQRWRLSRGWGRPLPGTSAKRD